MPAPKAEDLVLQIERKLPTQTCTRVAPCNEKQSLDTAAKDKKSKIIETEQHHSKTSIF